MESPGKKKKPYRQTTGEEIKYLVRDDKGQFVIDLPAHWKVTFAAVNPAQPSHRDSYCLRVYEAEKLRAVFVNVRSFRDLAIPLARELRTETGKAEWKGDSVGNYEKSSSVAVDSVWELEAGEDDHDELTEW